MKKTILEFFRRGLVVCGLGPLVLAVLYLIFHQCHDVQMLSVDQVVTGIFSLSALAFIAGGMNVLYQIERLPLMVAILIHGGTLYMTYLATYLVNNWLEWGTMQIMVFTAIFVLGYLAVWAVIYSATKRKTRRINEILLKKQQSADGT